MQAFDDSDSGDDFASASEGEYDAGAAPSPSSVQHGQLKQIRRKSFRPKKNAEETPSSPPAQMHVQPDARQVPLQHSSIDSPPTRTLGSLNIQHSAGSQSLPSSEADASSSHHFHESRTTSSLHQTHSFSAQQGYRDQAEPNYNHSSRMPPRMSPSNMQNPGAQRGWGSLSSWINTAVSTVSEVIENPNVVVSKAQNISMYLQTQWSAACRRTHSHADITPFVRPIKNKNRPRNSQCGFGADRSSV